MGYTVLANAIIQWERIGRQWVVAGALIFNIHQLRLPSGWRNGLVLDSDRDRPNDNETNDDDRNEIPAGGHALDRAHNPPSHPTQTAVCPKDPHPDGRKGALLTCHLARLKRTEEWAGNEDVNGPILLLNPWTQLSIFLLIQP